MESRAAVEMWINANEEDEHKLYWTWESVSDCFAMQKALQRIRDNGYK